MCGVCFNKGRHPWQRSGMNYTYEVNHKIDSFPLFIKQWSARDELELIEGIMRHGLGNWHDVAE